VSDDLRTRTFGAGEEALTYTLDSRDFTCDDPPITMDMTSCGYDAVITSTVDIDGTWTSNTSFEVNSAMVICCTGSDCAALDVQNCSGKVSGTAALAQ